MTYIGARIRYLRTSEKMTQQELADGIGVAKSTISMYENGQREPDFETLETLADYFNVDMRTFFPGGRQSPIASPLPSNVRPLPRFVKKPRLGSIACGKPILAIEEAEEFDDVPAEIDCDFTLICKGDSMINARILDGDTVYIRQQEEVENGQIAAVRIGDEATLKRVYYNGHRIILRACNPLYEDLEYEGEELNEIEIIGLAVAFSSMLK